MAKMSQILLSLNFRKSCIQFAKVEMNIWMIWIYIYEYEWFLLVMTEIPLSLTYATSNNSKIESQFW